MRPGKLPSNHKFYWQWLGMKARCDNPNTESYNRYGGRGIRYCERWRVFENFYDDMFSGWSEGKLLDRQDNDGDYTPENCVWSSRLQSGRCTSRVKLTMALAEEIRKKHSLGHSKTQLAKEHGVSRFAIYSLLKGSTWA